MDYSSKPRILYIDDEKENLDGFYFSFMDDYYIHTTQLAQEAEQIVTNENIEIVIADQKMPEISGIKLVQKLQTHKPDIVPIIVTAHASLNDVLCAINDANIFRFISKPWNINQIKATIQDAIDYYRLKKQNISLVEELKIQNKKLIKANEIAEKSNQLKTAFLANLSHEIRTPLNAIVGFSSLIAGSNTEIERLSDYSDIIIENSNALLDIIDQTVNVSKIETNQIIISKTPILIYDLLTEIFNSFSKDPNPNIQFTLHVPVELQKTEINCDETQLKQILFSLLNNAFKFTNSGSVTFGISNETEATLQQNGIIVDHPLFEDKDDHIFFYVQDTGKGIPSTHIDEIFEPFRKLSDDDKQVIGGLGLGLYYTSQILKKLNGQIFISSQPSQGSKFSFYISD